MYTLELLKSIFYFYFCQVTPPTLVQTQVEGGSTLFKFSYFGEDVSIQHERPLQMTNPIPDFEYNYYNNCTHHQSKTQ